MYHNSQGKTLSNAFSISNQPNFNHKYYQQLLNKYQPRKNLQKSIQNATIINLQNQAGFQQNSQQQQYQNHQRKLTNKDSYKSGQTYLTQGSSLLKQNSKNSYQNNNNNKKKPIKTQNNKRYSLQIIPSQTNLNTTTQLNGQNITNNQNLNVQNQQSQPPQYQNQPNQISLLQHSNQQLNPQQQQPNRIGTKVKSSTYIIQQFKTGDFINQLQFFSELYDSDNNINSKQTNNIRYECEGPVQIQQIEKVDFLKVLKRQIRENYGINFNSSDTSHNKSYVSQLIQESNDDTSSHSNLTQSSLSYDQNLNINNNANIKGFNNSGNLEDQQSATMKRPINLTIKNNHGIDEFNQSFNASLLSPQKSQSRVMESYVSGVSEDMMQNLNNNLIINIPQLQSPTLHQLSRNDQQINELQIQNLSDDNNSEEPQINDNFNNLFSDQQDLTSIRQLTQNTSYHSRKNQNQKKYFTSYNNSNYNLGENPQKLKQQNISLQNNNSHNNFSYLNKLIYQDHDNNYDYINFSSQEDFDQLKHFEDYFPHNNFASQVQKQKKDNPNNITNQKLLYNSNDSFSYNDKFNNDNKIQNLEKILQAKQKQNEFD
ncbi:hypothetical protein PPERSA_08620 [Pseudocohnilembus persalinus]|uniref:Uncharacterized protein n=1 Tax=Pseudocohnilembus persalinus TaxID=266149 RepID=A0A0V0R524_PSEPJ|nr:hypothetical protein PPERSA_08620 [Pseudocohnilembus persalinus]|eukprot:KRX09588.1 hypothetical protein PPERSA_08620 [Pseudocohnilembus persalinus]